MGFIARSLIAAAVIFGAVVLYTHIAAVLQPSRYAAEVGYYRGTEVAWDLWGDFSSLDGCRQEAIARYNFYAVEQRGRGHSWSCLLKNGKGGYTSRHR